MKFTIYDTQTGRVIHGGTADAPQLLAEAGHSVLEGATFVGGWLSNGTHHAQPVSPSANHVFNWQTKQWQDPRTLQDLKDAQWSAIKQSRDAAELGTFTYNGMVFDGDLNAQRRLAAYISVSKSALAAGEPFSAEFTLADNSLVTLSAQDFVGIELAKVQSVAAVFAHATALRAQIEAASTAAQVAAVVW